MRPARRLAGIVVLAVLSAALAACGGTGGDKAGGEKKPVVLELAAMEGEGAPYTADLQEFARQVNELSDGRIRVRIVWDGAIHYFGDYGPEAEQQMAGLVEDGKVDLAQIPARAWDKVGVTSLQALQAPFLVTTERVVHEVVQDEEISHDLLAGLEKAGVEGLVLLPEGLRHPVGYNWNALLAPEDFEGATIRSPSSRASYALLRALGAKPFGMCCEELTKAVATGRVQGAESEFAFGPDLDMPNTFTGNVTFFPKVNVLVASSKQLEPLSDGDREILREAAQRTLQKALRTDPTEAEQAAVYCRNGGKIASASAADIAGFESKASAVYAALERDSLTKDLIARIRGLRRSTAAEQAPSCAPPKATGEEASGGTKSELPEGVYRADLKAEELIAKGMDPITAHQLEALVTLTIKDGKWHTVEIRDGDRGGCWGHYMVKSGRFYLWDDSQECGNLLKNTLVMSATWRLENGALHFYDVRVGRPLEWGGLPWRKIG